MDISQLNSGRNDARTASVVIWIGKMQCCILEAISEKKYSVAYYMLVSIMKIIHVVSRHCWKVQSHKPNIVTIQLSAYIYRNNNEQSSNVPDPVAHWTQKRYQFKHGFHRLSICDDITFIESIAIWTRVLWTECKTQRHRIEKQITSSNINRGHYRFSIQLPRIHCYVQAHSRNQYLPFAHRVLSTENITS